jgi:ParB-like chromosome segregation protein Spo0J
LDFRNRIIGLVFKPADQLLAHPDNPRIHPPAQRTAVKASLNEIGWYDCAIENISTGRLIDGHERVWQALQNGNAEVPVLQVELSENEEYLALTTHDFMTQMATYEAETLDRLLREVNTTNADMQQLLSDIATKEGLLTDGLDTPDLPPVDHSVQCPQCGEIFTA